MGVVVVFVDRFYIALFSAFKLTHCALMIDYFLFFYSTFFVYPPKCVTALFDCYMAGAT